MGDPKSAAGERTIPLPPTVVKELRAWKDKGCPKKDGKLALVFPNGSGNLETHGNIIRIAPPLTITLEETLWAVDNIRAVFERRDAAR